MRLALTLAAVLGGGPCVGAQEAKAPAPRRLLFVHAGANLYLNPLGGDGPDRTRDAAERLAAALHVPAAKGNDQLFVLSDAPAAPHPPTRAALVQALDGFCSTTREQDRVVIYFGLHAVERDGRAFAVPLEGEPDEPGTLLPVADVYAKLKDLKAAQKVVVWDVCRSGPVRARGRPDAGPMSEALFKALTAAPVGVQVLVTCSPGERGRESSAPRGPGARRAESAYLEALRQTAADDFAPNAPGDAIPVGPWGGAAGKSVAAAATAAGAKQTPAVAGTAPARPAAHDPTAAPARRFEWPAAPKSPPAEVKAVLDELALPPLFDDDPAQVVRLPFGADALKSHAPDVEPDEILKNGDKYPLRVATLNALQSVRNVWPQGVRESKGLAALGAPVTDRTKAAVARCQDHVALAVVELELALAKLEAAAGHRAKEPLRWQAHYDYTVAELRLRLVVLNELNRQLGNVRTETLPDLPAGATGWRLVPSDKLASRKDVRDVLAAAQEGFARVAADHKGTPWEVLAKRSRATVAGLRWEPGAAPKGAGK